MSVFKRLTTLFVPDAQADRVVPPTGFTANLTTQGDFYQSLKYRIGKLEGE